MNRPINSIGFYLSGGVEKRRNWEGKGREEDGWSEGGGGRVKVARPRRERELHCSLARHLRSNLAQVSPNNYQRRSRLTCPWLRGSCLPHYTSVSTRIRAPCHLKRASFRFALPLFLGLPERRDALVVFIAPSSFCLSEPRRVFLLQGRDPGKLRRGPAEDGKASRGENPRPNAIPGHRG